MPTRSKAELTARRERDADRVMEQEARDFLFTPETVEEQRRREQQGRAVRRWLKSSETE